MLTVFRMKSDSDVCVINATEATPGRLSLMTPTDSHLHQK